jgi:hypothetical protein
LKGDDYLLEGRETCIFIEEFATKALGSFAKNIPVP